MPDRQSSNPTVLKPTVTGTAVQIRGWLPDAEQPFYDANHLLTLPKVDAVHISGTPHAHNLDALTKIGPLKQLHLEIYQIDQIDILERIDPSKLVSLHLEETAPRKLDLAVLKRFKKLENLFVRQEKNLSAVGDIPSLRKLTIRLMAKTPCDFISRLSNLEDLSLLLGAHKDIRGVNAPNLKRLETVRVRYLEELGDLARFPNLQRLEIENQPRLTNLRASSVMGDFRELTAYGCPKLKAFEGLQNLVALEKLDARGSQLKLPDLLGSDGQEPYFKRLRN